MIISQTPLRISFLGGGSDIPSYYRRNGGAVLSVSIDQSVYVTVSRKFDNAVRVSYSRTEEVSHSAQIEHPLVRESLAMLKIDGGVEITSIADIPAKGTGLGSSSSFTVGLLNALHAYCGRHSSAESLAVESCLIEIDRCGEPIGKQDQYAAAFGGFNFIRFNPDDSVEVRKMVCPQAFLADFQSHLLFFYTGVTRSASDLLRRQSTEIAMPGSKSDRMRELVQLTESAYADLCVEDLSSFGGKLNLGWRIKREITNGITNTAIDQAYDAAIAAGAQGGKVLGAGGGGFLMFFAPPELHDSIRRALKPLRETPFRFVAHGTRIIFVH